jgi:putative nucleotidyltransferase with HDIG domain
MADTVVLEAASLYAMPRAKTTSPRRPRGRKQRPMLPTSAILAPLSRALDLVEGHEPGHAVRSCLIGMRLGAAAGLGEEQLADLYYALLLKDAGGSSNAARVASLFGSDDQRVKPRMMFVDRDDRRLLARETWRNTAHRRSLRAKVGHLMGMVRDPNAAREIIAMRCERGAEIATRIGLNEGTAVAIRSLHEHWNGNGYPTGLRGDAIPPLSRIVYLAQTMDVFSRKDGQAAESVLRERRGQWFDPALTDVASELLHDDQFLVTLRENAEERVVEVEPASRVRKVDDDGVDAIARAFADIIDAKSPFTVGHSIRVAEYARSIGTQMGFDAQTLRNTYRAGLLHDIGMLGVSSRILEKAGTLTRAERAEIEHHPVQTLEIVQRVKAFEPFAMQAATHHEKLDGSGYPWGRRDEDLDAPARALVVADVFEAAMADRAFRRGVSVTEALEILNAQRTLWLDGDAIDALAACLPETEPRDL